MQIPRDAVLLRIFFGEDDKFERLPLYEAIVLRPEIAPRWSDRSARPRRIWPLQPHSHHQDFASVSGLACVVEIVDAQDKIDAFLPVLDGR